MIRPAFALSMSLLLLPAGCAMFGSTKSTPPPPAYTPSWTYRTAAPAADKVAVTIGIVAPQFTGDGERYYQEQKGAQATKDMIRAFRTSVPELLVAKGVATVGPYQSVSGLTYPEKKASDFLFYQDLDVAATYDTSDVKQEVPFMAKTPVTTCTVAIGLSGSVQVVLDEPMSGQRMWVKRVAVDLPKREYNGRGGFCSMQTVTPEIIAASPEIRDAWLQLHESLFRKVMVEMDRYLNAEELLALKAQSDELKGKKSY
jgi:hypothetical protein